MKQRLFTPGPTPVPESVVQRMTEPIIHHRSQEFSQVFQEVTEGLKYLFQTAQEVLTLTTSGTGGMEAAVVNLLSSGETALVVEGGKFGQRWSEICRAYGVQVEPIMVPWGEAVTPQEVVTRLKRLSKVRAVFLTHSETSTGVATDIEEVARVVREHSDALIVVDGISAVGALPMKMDAWGLDLVVSASQKGLMLPPGLAFVAVGSRAWNQVKKANLPRYYLCFQKARDALARGTTAFTPAISLILGLQQALRMIQKRGLEQLWRDHQIMAEAIRKGITALGLELFAKSPSNALTAVRLPQGLDGKVLLSRLKEDFGITIAGGQGPLKGKIFRIGHVGYFDPLDAIAILSALETTLKKLGWNFEPGQGLRAAQMVFSENCRT
ncbi:MAG: alanine--glyoxylate aminotransferase family protein [candidate division KSB1 bacterium]|nr:alanine--glyoxylate aminotransferase family protein [candidate division KSB1 bacterium]